MESIISEEFQEISQLIADLAAQRNEVREELKRVTAENDFLRQELYKVKDDLHRKNLDVEFLTLSRKLSDTPQALADARATVKRLILKVDKAIELLKEDAGI